MTFTPRRDPSPNPDPMPAGLTWQQVVWEGVKVFGQIAIATIAAVAAYYGAQNHSKIENVQKQASEVRAVQDYHEKQLDSIGSRIEKVDKAVKKSEPAFVDK